jgi:transcriptional regulator of acetoin/glycerol metabolism
MNALPASPFFFSRADRVELARRRFFDEGVMPTGVVSEAVFQSWARCQRLHTAPTRKVSFEPVTQSRTHLALQKNRHLRDAWLEEMPELETVLAATSCAAMLTDAAGLLIGAACAGRAHESLMPVATRLGVNLSEEAVGTTAPGVVARTGQPVTVRGGEHFFEQVKAMDCAAAPIRDIEGKLAGVLDISSECLPFSFDAAAVVALYAGAIENRLLVAQSVEHLVLRFQVAATLIDSPAAGLVGIGGDGRVAWCNGVASKLLGLVENASVPRSRTAEAALGATLQRLASLPQKGAAPLHLPNGLLVWARAQMQAPDGSRDLFYGHSFAAAMRPTADGEFPLPKLKEEAPANLPAAAGEALALAEGTLRDVDRGAIERALSDCKGNVSKAAKQLGVSRGLIYRRLRERD